jgi:hypothetical protein
MIQLTLFPLRGFGLLLPGHAIAHDFRTGMPYFVRTKRAAKRTADSLEGTWKGPADVVPLEIHEGEEIPTYVIGRSLS